MQIELRTNILVDHLVKTLQIAVHKIQMNKWTSDTVLGLNEIANAKDMI